MRSWSKAAEQKLRALYGRTPLPRISFLLKRTDKAVRSRAKVLGLKTGFRTPWTKQQLQILRREYADASTAHLVELIGRDRESIYSMAQKLGLHKSAAFHADAKRSGRFTNLSRAGERFRYPKGHVPANKGLRRPGYAPGRMATTQFKKGHKPHTYRYKIGDTRINTDGYIDQKVSEDKVGAMNWRGLHRLIWIKAHGPVPKGHVVAFKDSNKLNCALENLELMTKADNARRNSIWKKLPKELAQIVQLKGAIHRQINRRLGRTEERNRGRRNAERRAVRNAKRLARQGEPDGGRSGPGDRPGC